MGRQIFVAGSSSVRAWLPEFCRHADPASTIVCPTEISDLLLAAPGADGRAVEFVFLSDHETMSRDRAWAALLRRVGFRASCQSAAAVGAGLDKVEMKRAFDAADVPHLPWRTATEASPGYDEHRGPVVVKQRSGTQSRGIRMAPNHERPAPEEYGEAYLDGTEYSVNVFAADGSSTVLPPAWKGRTGPALVPPWLRTRVCAPGFVPASLEAELHRVSRQVVRSVDAAGFVEVEFLVSDSGEAYVLEVNPRVSGTLRLSALAAAEPVFSWYARPPARETAGAVAWAVEIPHRGPPVVISELATFATSRLTVAADSAEELARRARVLRERAVVCEDGAAQLEAAVAAATAEARAPHRSGRRFAARPPVRSGVVAPTSRTVPSLGSQVVVSSAAASAPAALEEDS